MAAWYCLIGDKEYGPFSSERIQSLVQKGKLTRDHSVRTSTDTQWTPASDIPGLFPSEEPKAAAPKTAPPKAKPPASPPPAKARPPVAAETTKPPMPTALPVTSEEPELPSALPVAAPVAAPVDAPVATPVAAPVATPVAAPASMPVAAPVTSSSPASPPKDPAETIAHARKKSKQQQYLIAGGLGAALIILGIAGVWALNRSPKTESEEQEIAQSKPDQTKPVVPAEDIEADPNPETDPPVKEPVRQVADAKKSAALPAISRWLDASRKQGVLRFSDSMIKFHVVNVWLDSSDSGARTVTVELTLTNGSSSESLDFRGWSLAEGAKMDDAVVLADDKDNRLSASSAPGRSVRPGSASRRLKPKESVKDQLIFEAPTGEYEQLRLRLPYAAIGRTGYMGFEIPAVMIQDRPPGEEEPVAADAKPDIMEPDTDDAAPKPEIAIKPPAPPKSDDPFSIDVLRNSIEESMSDGEEPKPDTDSKPFPSDTPEQPDIMDGSGAAGDMDGQMGERNEEE